MALQTRSGAEGRRRDLNQEEAYKDVPQYPRPLWLSNEACG